MKEHMALDNGPIVDVNLLLCPAPFVIKAECGRTIGGLNGYGTIGWYFFAPWHVYAISLSQTWIS